MRSHAALDELARRQHGVVSYRQLRELSFSKGHVARACEARRIRRVHRGVYSVGHAELGDRGRCLAAVLASGPDAIVSHLSAAWLWGFWDRCEPEVELSVARGGRRKRGIRVHRSGSFAGECGDIDGIPVTSLPRTLLDVAATRSRRELTAVVDRAARSEDFDLGAVETVLARRPRTPGRRRLREAIDLYLDPAFNRARSELLFLELVKKEGLPRPSLNRWVDKWEIDAYWARERFAVEVDGWQAHGSRRSFEDNRLRIEDMKLARIDAIRVTARRVEREPAAVGKRLRLHLERRSAELGL